LFKIFLYILLFFIVISSCSVKKDEQLESSPILKGSRQFGIHITQGQGESFNSAFSVIDTAGFDFVTLHQIWGDGGLSGLPVTPLTTNAAGSSFDFTNVDSANAFYPANSKTLMLTIGTIDTNNKFVPSDFNAVSFDDSTLRIQFKTLLSQLIPRLSSTQIVSLQIGNEVDVRLQIDSTAWSEYKIFFDDVSAYAKTLRSDLKIGVTTTLAGAISNSQKALIQDLNSTADVVVVTYYPMNADFTMKSPSVVTADLTALVSLYPTKPIYIQEIGYSSGSSFIGSSEEQQRQFVQNFFTVWDSFSINIPVVAWLNLTEWSSTSVDGFGTQYGICPGTYCNGFKEYLQTLGLRRYNDSTSKPAFDEINLQMQSRQW